MRAAAEGVRVFAVAIVVGVAIGTGDIASIAILSVLTLIYTFEGGMAAVIWTDVVQMVLYIGGSLLALAMVCHHIPGGWSGLLAGASAAHKLTMLHFSWSIAETYTFQAGLIGGTLPHHGQPRNRSAHGAAPAGREKPQSSPGSPCSPAASLSSSSSRCFSSSARACFSSTATPALQSA